LDICPGAPEFLVTPLVSERSAGVVRLIAFDERRDVGPGVTSVSDTVIKKIRLFTSVHCYSSPCFRNYCKKKNDAYFRGTLYEDWLHKL